ncbi:MAG: carbonic anhydrase family protein [Herminiimonas sp.]|nr:carbonic anhydrase family protein [Herminiimonas sp.]
MIGHANDDPHAAPGAGAAPAAAPAAKVIKEPVAVAETKPAPVPALGNDGKPIPAASPQEVAFRIAERLARLRAATAERPVVKRKVTPPVQWSGKSSGTDVHASAGKAGAASLSDHKALHWSYGGEEGPIRWADMSPEWAACGSGNRQSPIDIRSGIKVDLEPIGFDYKPTGFSVIDNGHTIQVNLGAGNHITVGSRMFELVQFHFHRPSEERINGRAFDMVAHLVHRDANGKLAVVAVLIERGAGRKLVQTVWNNMPLEKNEAVTPAGALDMNDILPAKREYFTYMGSLTTPPCSEGVLWLVMKEPVSISQEQIDIFARMYQMNARPIQATAARLIKESN